MNTQISQALRAAIADDAFAASFQTLGQYRQALVRILAAEGAGQAGQVAMPDKAAFEAQAKYQGAANLMPADNAMCWNGWFPATYLDPATELAWRVWANKPSPTERAAAPAGQDAQQFDQSKPCRNVLMRAGYSAVPKSCPRCGLSKECPAGHAPSVRDRATHQPSAQDGGEA